MYICVCRTLRHCIRNWKHTSLYGGQYWTIIESALDLKSQCFLNRWEGRWEWEKIDIWQEKMVGQRQVLVCTSFYIYNVGIGTHI